jgi:sugar fermentation stimulation protein A
MQFPQPLTRGVLVRRYKRFFADVMLDDGREVTAHIANPGAMLGLKDAGIPVWLSPSQSETRKLAWTWEMAEENGGLVGVNTHHPNRLVAEALEARAIPQFAAYDSVRREVRYGEASRIDFLLERSGERLWLEVKNCHFSRTPGLAEFPDCVAARSAKHLRELAHMVEAGDRATVLFVVQREDCDRFSACRDIDPVFAAALDGAADAGVEVLVHTCAMRPDSITLGGRIPWEPDTQGRDKASLANDLQPQVWRSK